MFLFYARKISTKMSLKYVAHWHHHISTYEYVLTDIGSFVIFYRKEFLHTVQNSFSQITMCDQLLLCRKLRFPSLVKYKDIHWCYGIQLTKPSDCLPWWISLSLSCKSRRSDSCNSSWSCLFCSLYLSLGLEPTVIICACCPPVTTLDCLANLLGLNLAFPI